MSNNKIIVSKCPVCGRYDFLINRSSAKKHTKELIKEILNGYDIIYTTINDATKNLGHKKNCSKIEKTLFD